MLARASSVGKVSECGEGCVRCSAISDIGSETGFEATTSPVAPGSPYQEAAAKARVYLEDLADLYTTPAREAELIVIFKEATRLEADF